MKFRSFVFILFLIFVVSISGCVSVATPTETPVVLPTETVPAETDIPPPTSPPTSTPVVIYLDDCLPGNEQPINVAPNPCFMGKWEYSYGDHRWSIPYLYRPVFIDGIGGESAANVTMSNSEIIFDLTYFSGYMGLMWEQQMTGGQAYMLVLRGSSTLRVDSWEEGATNFAAEASVYVNEVPTLLSSHSMGIPAISEYGTPYYVMTGEREFVWAIFADTNLVAEFDVGFKSTWKTGHHGSSFVLKSISLVPIEWTGSLDGLTVIRH